MSGSGEAAPKWSRVIGRFPGESSRLTLVWAVLDLYQCHQRPNFTQLERERLKQMRYQDREPTNSEEVSAA